MSAINSYTQPDCALAYEYPQTAFAKAYKWQVLGEMAMFAAVMITIIFIGEALLASVHPGQPWVCPTGAIVEFGGISSALFVLGLTNYSIGALRKSRARPELNECIEKQEKEKEKKAKLRVNEVGVYTAWVEGFIHTRPPSPSSLMQVKQKIKEDAYTAYEYDSSPPFKV